MGSVAAGLRTPAGPLPESDPSPGSTAPPTVRSSQSDSRQPSSPHAAPLKRCPPTPPPSCPNLVREPRGRPAPSKPGAGRQTAPAPTPLKRRRGGSARQVRARHRAGCAHAPSPPGCQHSGPQRQSRPVGRVSMSDRPPKIGFLPSPHDSLAPESRQPPEFRSPSPLPRNEIRGRAASRLRNRIALSGRLAGRKRTAAFPGRPFPLPSCRPPPPSPPLPQQLPPWCERFRLATESLPGCRACPVR